MQLSINLMWSPAIFVTRTFRIRHHRNILYFAEHNLELRKLVRKLWSDKLYMVERRLDKIIEITCKTVCGIWDSYQVWLAPMCGCKKRLQQRSLNIGNISWFILTMSWSLQTQGRKHCGMALVNISNWMNNRSVSPKYILADTVTLEIVKILGLLDLPNTVKLQWLTLKRS